MITSGAAAKLKVRMLEEEGNDDVMRRTRVNNTIIGAANPVTVGALVEMAILMRNERGSHNFYALHVRNDNSTASKALSMNALSLARKTGSQADVAIETLDRYDLNTVTGLLNVIEERDITEVMLGMHQRATVIDSFFGSKIEQLLRSTNKMVLMARCYIPVNTITRVVVWVPAGAQYETASAAGCVP